MSRLMQYGLWVRRTVTQIDDRKRPLIWDSFDTWATVLMTVIALLVLLTIGSCLVVVVR